MDRFAGRLGALLPPPSKETLITKAEITFNKLRRGPLQSGPINNKSKVQREREKQQAGGGTEWREAVFFLKYKIV